MKALLIVGLLLLPAASAHAEPARVETADFTSDGAIYKITAKVREGGDPKGIDRVWVDYSVSRDGKFVHPLKGGGGVLFGCSFTTSPVSFPKHVVEPLLVEGKQLGWILAVGGICGNTSSKKYQLVLPRLSGKEPRPYQDGYFWTEFVAKYKPVFRGTGLVE